MRDDPDSSCLSRLFAAAPFGPAPWPEQTVVCHGPLSRLGALASLPELAHLGSLLAAYEAPVRVALPGKRDEHSSMHVEPAAAEAKYREGLALIFDRVERFIPLVAQWVEQLRLELSLPARCEARSIVYATPSGGGNSPHFDANVNVVVQLKGTKRWRLAMNHHVRRPTDRFAMNQGAPSEELEVYVEAPFPTRMPEHAAVVDLVPGSVLFVPRGYWHETEASEDTLALNFTFSQPTWVDGVLLALRTRLLQHEAWREVASGTIPEALLAQLQDEVMELSEGEVFTALDGRPWFELAEDAFLQVEGGAAVVSVGGDALVLDVEERMLPVLEWLAGQPRPFSLEDVTLHFPEVASGVSGLVKLLVAKGVVHAVGKP